MPLGEVLMLGFCERVLEGTILGFVFCSNCFSVGGFTINEFRGCEAIVFRLFLSILLEACG